MVGIIRLITTVFFCTAALASAQMVTLDSTDFSSGWGNWKWVAFSSQHGTRTLDSGWARVDAGGAGGGDFDDWTNSWTSPEADGYWLVSTGVGIYIKAPATGDWSFETEFRQGDWGIGHHAGNRSVMVRSSLDPKKTIWVATMFGSNNGNIVTMVKSTAMGDATGCHELGGGTQGLGFKRPNDGPIYVHIDKVENGYTFNVSSDGKTWTQIDVQAGLYNGYILLADSYANGWTEYKYAVLKGTPAAVNNKVSGRSRPDAVCEYSKGNLSVRISGSGNVTVRIYDSRGKIVLRRSVSESGAHRIGLDLLPGVYDVKYQSAGRSGSERITVSE